MVPGDQGEHMTTRHGVPFLPIGPPLASLAMAIADLGDAYNSVTILNASRSTKGSAARSEEDEASAFVGGRWSAAAVEEAHGVALAKLIVAQEGLQAVGMLMGRGGVFTPWPVGRTVVEASATAFWLFDDSISMRKRVARVFVDRLISLDYITKLPGELGLPDSGYESERDSVIGEATGMGFSVLVEPRRVGGERRPGHKTLTAQMYGEAGAGHYNLLSNFSHAEYFAFVQAFENNSETEYRQPRVDRLALLSAIVVSAFLKAVERQICFYGWKLADFSAQKTETLKTINELIPGQWRITLPYFNDTTGI